MRHSPGGMVEEASPDQVLRVVRSPEWGGVLTAGALLKLDFVRKFTDGLGEGSGA